MENNARSPWEVMEHIDVPHFPGTIQNGCPGCEAFWVELEPNDENDDWAMAHHGFSEDTYDPDGAAYDPR